MAKIEVIDFEQVEDRKEFGIIPPQDVIAAITGSDYKPNKAGTGHGLNFELQILDGEFAGRKLWDLLSLDNPNADTVRIAQSTLKQILAATNMIGKFGDDTDVLHDIPMVISVEVEPENTDKVTGKVYKAKNVIKKYSPLQAGQTAPVAATPTAANKPLPTAAAATAANPKAGLPPFLANKKA